jgi:hypothetical protein
MIQHYIAENSLAYHYKLDRNTTSSSLSLSLLHTIVSDYAYQFFFIINLMYYVNEQIFIINQFKNLKLLFY